MVVKTNIKYVSFVVLASLCCSQAVEAMIKEDTSEQHTIKYQPKLPTEYVKAFLLELEEATPYRIEDAMMLEYSPKFDFNSYINRTLIQENPIQQNFQQYNYVHTSGGPPPKRRSLDLSEQREQEENKRRYAREQKEEEYRRAALFYELRPQAPLQAMRIYIPENAPGPR